jgi:hypothetical protein
LNFSAGSAVPLKAELKKVIGKSLVRKLGRVEITIKKQLLYSTKFSKQDNQRTLKEKGNIPDLTFQILLK